MNANARAAHTARFLANAMEYAGESAYLTPLQEWAAHVITRPFQRVFGPDLFDYRQAIAFEEAILFLYMGATVLETEAHSTRDV